MNPYPVILNLMRHAESSENVVFNHETDAGEHAAFDDVIKDPTWRRRLSRPGVQQVMKARAAFEAWRRSLEQPYPLVGYASHYYRARETAGLMDLGLRWKLDVRPSERNWGMMTFLTEDELTEHFPFAETYRERDGLLWSPVGGDSMQLVIAYVHDFMQTLARDCAQNEVIVVTHGEAMYAFQYVIEHWLPEELTDALQGKRAGAPRIGNCMTIQYTRIGQDGTVHPHYVRKRFVDPVTPRVFPWNPIASERTFSAEELLAQVADVERHV